MLGRGIKEFFEDGDKKRLFENFFSLSILQGANYIFPLITLPYLVRILGPEKFGLISFAQAFIQYFNILTDYGFNLSATREISIYRRDKEKISEIFSSVMIIKLGLLVLSFMIMTIIVFCFKKFREDWLIYYLTFGMIIGQVLFPVWFFQGIERMKYITILNIIAKSIFIISIFVFIREVSDYIYVPLINSLGFIVAGILALWIVFRGFGVKFLFPQKSSLLYHLKEGGYIFLSRVAISFYTVSNIFILGLMTNNIIVAYYSVAEKLVKVLQQLGGIILQVMFPFVSKLVTNAKKEALVLVRKEIKYSMLAGVVIIIFIIIFSEPLIFFLFGEKFMSSVLIFRILSITPVIILLSAIIGQQILLNFNLKRLFTLSIVCPSIVHFFILLFFIKIWGAIGAAIAVVITESLVLLIRFFFLLKERKDIFETIFGG